MEISSIYDISILPTSGGQYQAHLHKKTKVKDGIKLGEPLYSSKKYPTEEQAYQDVKNHYDNLFGIINGL
ncbi:MAG: hypothetical protein C5B52_08105 [Bacteroidetes bacterium]|nr:MAG: hypothetical protein C5B52_08105 [Bacteroidota bacterium]